MKEARKASFDALTEPWIPCVMLDGNHVDLSVMAVFAEAHTVREVVDSSPITTAGILRFLIAIMHDSLRLDDEDEWAEAWGAGRLDGAFLERLRHSCSGRFDLFHERHPFYQTGDALPGDVPKAHRKSVGYLTMDAAAGGGVTHYSHAGEDDHAYCSRCCAKGLVTLPPFATSGGSGIKPSISGVPPVYVFPIGESLFFTLLLNYVLPNSRPSMQCDTDPGPIWREDGVVVYKDERVTTGFIESLTWQPRRVRLIPDRGGECTRCGADSPVLVRQMLFAQGRSRSKDAPLWQDPWAAYRWRVDRNGRLTYKQLMPQEDRDTWRDIASLFLAHSKALGREGRGTYRPAIVSQVDRLLVEGVLQPGTPIRFVAVGMRTDMRSKIFEWRYDHFDFPPVVLRDKAAYPARQALWHADQVAGIMGDSICRLHPGADRRKPKWGDIRKALDQTITLATQDYWHLLEPAFRAKLGDPRLVGEEGEQAFWLAEWRKEVRSAARRVFEAVLDSYDADAAELARQQAARRHFYGTLKGKEVTSDLGNAGGHNQ